MATVVDVARRVNVSNVLCPIVDCIGPGGIRIVARVPGQTGGKVEEDSLGDGVLVVVAVVGQGDLPAQTTVAIIGAPSGGLRVEDGLGQGQPLGFVGVGVLEIALGGEHGGHAPEALVIVSERGRPVFGHVPVVRGTRLEDKTILRQIVVCGVCRVMPVIDQGSPHGTCLPPVVVAIWRRAGEDAWSVACDESVLACL